MARVWLKWAPALAVPILIASVAIVVPMAANAAVSLPSKSAQQVLSLLANEKISAFSGTLAQSSDLGLPSLPPVGNGSGATGEATATLALLSGSHSARVYANGSSQLRVQILDSLAERDFVRNGSEIWFYDSKAHTAVHASSPARQPDQADLVAPTVRTPEQLVTRLLAAASPSTSFSVGPDVNVAGRTAYNLVMTPQATTSLIGSISIAVDSATGLPLRFAVTARGASNVAFSVAFTSIALAKPDASLFSFTAPPGTLVSQKADSPSGHRMSPNKQGHAVRQGEPATRPSVSGTGWASIVAIPSSSSTNKALSNVTVNKLSTPIAGGRLFHSTLVNVLVTSDGRIFAGAVSPALLEVAASKK